MELITYLLLMIFKFPGSNGSLYHNMDMLGLIQRPSLSLTNDTNLVLQGSAFSEMKKNGLELLPASIYNCFIYRCHMHLSKLFCKSNNWIEAKNECEKKEGGRLANLDELYPSSCANKSPTKVWLGKYDHERLTPWIVKTGCFFREKKFRQSIESFLECLKSCKSAPFGYRKPWCSCEDKTTTKITFESFSACTTGNEDALWFFNKTDIDVSYDDYTMDCITAQCTGNGTNFRAVNCSSRKKAECQAQGFEYTTAGKDTQAISEKSCNEKITYLTLNPKCLSNEIGERNTEEIWTGMKRYRYNITESLTGNNKKVVNVTAVFNCVYIQCSIEGGQFEYTENCRQQLDGFACISNGTSYDVTTVKPSTETFFPPAIMTLSESSSLHTEYLSTNVSQQPTADTNIQMKSSASMHVQSNIGKTLLTTKEIPDLFSYHTSKTVASSSINTSFTSARTNDIDMSSTSYGAVVPNRKETESRENKSTPRTTTMNSSHQYSTVNLSSRNTLVPAIISSSESSSLHISTNVPPTSIVETSLWMKNSVLMHTQSNIGSSIQQTREMMHTQSNIGSSIQQTSEMMHTQSNIGSSMLQTSEMMHTQSNIGSSMLQTSEMMHTQSNIGRSIQQTSATSELINVYASKILASLTTISKSHINSNIDMSTAVYSSVVKNKNGTDLNKSNQMSNTTIRNQKNNSSQQLSTGTGLIVGISVSILCLVVLIIGVFGICRLRKQRAFKEKSSLDFPIPTNDSNYHDIDVDPKKETNVNENDSTNPVVSANDDDMPFRLMDNTSNGKTNKPNNAYAVVVKTPVNTKADNTSNGKTTTPNNAHDAYAIVVKTPVTTKADNTSNDKTTKSNNAHDAYAVVIKTPETNQDRDEKTSLSIPESNYDSMNQPRPISGNESGNIYDTSIGHRDETDPTYNTTTHIQEMEEKYESDYDHL